MALRPRRTALLILAWVLFSFAVASYHPPQTLGDRVLARAGRYDTWHFDPREDMRRFVLVAVPGLLLGLVLLRRSSRG